MKDFVSILGLNGVPQLFMRSNDYIDQYRGQKAIIAVMAADRNHPEFEKADRYLSVFEDHNDVVVIEEDHPDGPMHEAFQCKAGEFCFALVDKEGRVVMRDDHMPTLKVVRDSLHLM